jgi:CPA1 family monovalent cation:H+ antiporter
VIVFLLNSLLFILLGLQLPAINAAVVRLYSLDALILYAGAVVLAVMVIRLIWVMLAFYLPGRLFAQKKSGRTSFAEALIIGWSGMRGGISLAAVLTLPSNFPSASLVVFLVFYVILATLVLQGLSLPWLIRKLNVSNKDTVEMMEMRARLEMARAALRTLDTLVEDSQKVSPGIASLRNRYTQLCRALSAQLDEENVDEDQKQTAVEYVEKRQRIRQEIIAAEREILTVLVNQRKLPEEIAHRLNRELDLDEVLLYSRLGH